MIFINSTFPQPSQLYHQPNDDDAPLVVPSVVAKTPASFSATVWQNPVGNAVKMNVISDAAQTISITISDAKGSVKAQQKAVLYKGNNTVIVNARNWQMGVYLVKLYNAAGEVVSVRVFK